MIIRVPEFPLRNNLHSCACATNGKLPSAMLVRRADEVLEVRNR